MIPGTVWLCSFFFQQCFNSLHTYLMTRIAANYSVPIVPVCSGFVKTLSWLNSTPTTNAHKGTSFNEGSRPRRRFSLDHNLVRKRENHESYKKHTRNVRNVEDIWGSSQYIAQITRHSHISLADCFSSVQCRPWMSHRSVPKQVSNPSNSKAKNSLAS